MEQEEIIQDYLSESSFPSEYGYQLYKGSKEISDSEYSWLLIGQRSWFIEQITLDQSMNAVSKLAEIRNLLQEWSSGEEEETEG